MPENREDSPERSETEDMQHVLAEEAIDKHINDTIRFALGEILEEVPREVVQKAIREHYIRNLRPQLRFVKFTRWGNLPVVVGGPFTQPKVASEHLSRKDNEPFCNN